MDASPQQHPPVEFETDPSRYHHWQVQYDGAIAKVLMRVDAAAGLRPGYELKLNSYDLGVDIELADVVRRLRFEHPEVRTVVVTSGHDNVFCAGANIFMLGSSTHAWKVNFCKFTNETRCEIEDATAHSDQVYVAALNGTCAGGGYELALACAEIYLQDDGNSAVSLPEVPLLGVLPGTGGLTRVVDKRKVRRDRADIFCTTAEGVRGKRALQWGLVDAVFPRSRFEQEVAKKAKASAERKVELRPGERTGVTLGPITPDRSEGRRSYRHVALIWDTATRTATITVKGPSADDVALVEKGAAAIHAAGDQLWALRAMRELDDALLWLRFNLLDIGLVLLRTEGDSARVLAHDRALFAARDHWFVSEVALHMARVLRRLDLTSRSFYALGDATDSAFAGCLLELALAADRFYLLDDEAVRVGLGPLNFGTLPMSHGPSRLSVRLAADPDQVARLHEQQELMDPEAADEAGLVTVRLDKIDWDDDTRVAIEERASMSPDALTGMEANLRFVGAENDTSKIFARLTAWQNWIFIRPNATGPEGALSLYGKPQRPHFDLNRV
ncbi:2,3-epoxybenzoyl-CoA dihydrolase [Nannocystis bainbridge]|uniref:2,3-epoxybenzoyl-CoA dihydrolase n=1 Tax=Nannocystis bainbridge TaxID=2995303 RepID=A0ABT5DYW2_9BACT|nr:2,3-epoxybenzoyl-CoA dihydrolase [Nannocystis bainbridge]MDC0718254.1 2,3-epoxybenzoyl-CoA dihydrolase [Nannocystis bainbridge]